MAKLDTEIEENLEISATTGAGVPVQLPKKVISIFPAFAHRNFQLYFAGQAISLIGFWLHQVGLGWLAFQLTHSAFWVGMVAAAGGLPFLIFTTFAGVFVDKVNKQKLLIVTQAVEAVIAISIGVLILNARANIEIVIVLVFINGIVGAIDLPTRLTFLVEMVGKKDLASAVPINNGLFNAARFIGPGIAGALIAGFGLAWPFIINGLSFIAGIVAIVLIKPIYGYKVEVDVHPVDSLKRGIHYTFTHPQLFYFMVLATTNAIFIWPYQTLMPIVAERVYASGAQGLGSLLSAAGAGSVFGAVITSLQARKGNKGKIVVFGLIASSLSLMLFAINNNFFLAHMLLFFAGAGVLAQVSMLNTLVQLTSPDQMRGRIMAVYLTMFVGMMPVGNVIAGSLAEKTSVQFTIGIGAVAVLIVGGTLYLKGIFANIK